MYIIKEVKNLIFKHSTSKTTSLKILKNGFVKNKAVFGNAVYLQPLNGIHGYSREPTSLIVTLVSNINLFKGFNNGNGYNKFHKFLKDKNLTLNNVDNYFLDNNYDGLDMLNFTTEPQVVLYNLKSIQSITGEIKKTEQTGKRK